MPEPNTSCKRCGKEIPLRTSDGNDGMCVPCVDASAGLGWRVWGFVGLFAVATLYWFFPSWFGSLGTVGQIAGVALSVIVGAMCVGGLFQSIRERSWGGAIGWGLAAVFFLARVVVRLGAWVL